MKSVKLCPFFSVYGQSTIFLVVLLPLLLLISGIIVRSGQLMLEQNKVQSHCDKKVLDSLMWQGRGLEALGKLNPYARTIIQARRTVDAMLVAGIVDPPSIPPLMRARAKLIKIQRSISLLQKKIRNVSALQAARVINEPSAMHFINRVVETPTPRVALLPHASESTIILHIQEEEAFAGETGAPLRLDSDFYSRQRENLKIKMMSEAFVNKWMELPKFRSIQVQCQAQIKMNMLEGPWRAQLL